MRGNAGMSMTMTALRSLYRLGVQKYVSQWGRGVKSGNKSKSKHLDSNEQLYLFIQRSMVIMSHLLDEF